MATIATVKITDAQRRAYAVECVRLAPTGSVVTIREASRSLDQNAALWAALEDVAKAKPEGREHDTETWKCLFLHKLEHELRFEIGLDGRPFPMGFRSSHLSKAQFSDLLESIHEYGARHGVIFREPMR
jgi:hypothetical protein